MCVHSDCIYYYFPSAKIPPINIILLIQLTVILTIIAYDIYFLEWNGVSSRGFSLSLHINLNIGIIIIKHDHEAHASSLLCYSLIYSK